MTQLTLQSPYGWYLAPECIAGCLLPPEPKVLPKVWLDLEDSPAVSVQHIDVNPAGGHSRIFDADTVLLHIGDEEG